MNKKELVALGIDEAVADQIIVLHGKDIEAHKKNVALLQGELDTTKTQLIEAGKTIEGFKTMDVDAIKKSADDYKAAAEKARADADVEIAQLKFDHALDTSLSNARAKNVKAVKALLNVSDLKLDADGKLIGFKDQIEKVRADNEYLFIDESEMPKIVTGTNSSSVISDAVVLAARKAAGVPPPS